MDISFALTALRHFRSADVRGCQLEHDERLEISRSRRAIELQEQELMQLALLEERQKSA
jgi:hypothetical protein